MSLLHRNNLPTSALRVGSIQALALKSMDITRRWSDFLPWAMAILGGARIVQFLVNETPAALVVGIGWLLLAAAAFFKQFPYHDKWGELGNAAKVARVMGGAGLALLLAGIAVELLA